MQFDLSSIIRDKTDEQISIELEMSQISVNDVIYPIAEKKPLDLFLIITYVHIFLLIVLSYLIS